MTRFIPYYRNSQQKVGKNRSALSFRHLPPDSTTTGYATEVALLLSAHLSTDAVIALRKVWVLIRPWKQQYNIQART